MAAGWRILHAYGTPNPQDTALSRDGTVMKVGLGRQPWEEGEGYRCARHCSEGRTHA